MAITANEKQIKGFILQTLSLLYPLLSSPPLSLRSIYCPFLPLWVSKSAGSVAPGLPSATPTHNKTSLAANRVIHTLGLQ